MTHPDAGPCRFVVLISGRGSNMQHIVERARLGGWPASFVQIISNEPDAPGLAWAQAQGLPTDVLAHRDFSSREAFDLALADRIDEHAPDYVLLAGFMRILSPAFVQRFRNRLINIHPSLLPAFPGLKTHERALQAGVGWHGCTVHVVTDELDHGPIIAQAAVAVRSDDSVASLRNAVLQAEHELYPLVVQWLANGQVKVNDSAGVTVSSVAQRHLWINR